jgi:hypothetical protein
LPEKVECEEIALQSCREARWQSIQMAGNEVILADFLFLRD